MLPVQAGAGGLFGGLEGPGLHLSVSPLKDGLELLVPGQGIGIGPPPVSYTHLDVYKRQAENCPVSVIYVD